MKIRGFGDLFPRFPIQNHCIKILFLILLEFFCLTIHPNLQLYFGKEKISRKISIPPTPVNTFSSHFSKTIEFCEILTNDIFKKNSYVGTNCTHPVGRVLIVTEQLRRYKLYQSSRGGTNCNRTVM